MQKLLIAAIALTLTSRSLAQVQPYTQDFEGMNITDANALANDNWHAYGNVFDDQVAYQYGYYAGGAPNVVGLGFCHLLSGAGGQPQGQNQLVVYSDYNNPDHQNLDWFIEANTYKEWTIDASDIGKTYLFTFDAALGDLVVPSQALAFIKVINTNTWDLSGLEVIDMAAISTNWTTFSIPYTIPAEEVGFLFQIGFLSTASNYDASGVLYDNIILDEDNGGVGPGTNYCISTVNSTGAASVISATGSASIASDNLVLTAINLPGQPGIFIAGPGQDQIPFFNGFLCVSPSGLQRFSNVSVPSSGTVVEAVSIASAAPGGLNVSAGQPYYFQRWNRDPAGGGASANFSDGLEVTYTP